MDAEVNTFGNALAEFATFLCERSVALVRPAKAGEVPRLRARFLKPSRQFIQWISDTFKGQLDVEERWGHPQGGVVIRARQHLLAMTACIRHNHHCGVAPSSFPRRPRSGRPLQLGHLGMAPGGGHIRP
jgi:hypothetical protein